MPNRVPTARYTEARHSSMRTSLSSAGVCWRTLMGYPSYARNRACALPYPSPFHYVLAKIVPVVKLAAHAKSSTLYGRSYNYVLAKIVSVVQLAAHAKSSTLYGRSYVPNFFGLKGYYYFV